MAKEVMPPRFTVMGSPIKHSLSPLIHRQFAEQTQVKMSYERSLVSPELFGSTLEQFREKGGRGANITVPLKELAYQAADVLSPRAEAAGAVNTLFFTEQGLLGDNTDGAGLLSDLTGNLALDLNQKKVLIVGAGGTARGILSPLLLNNAQVTIANRTESKAENLAKMFATEGGVQACGLNDITGTFDLIINATSASLSGEELPLSPTILNKKTVCYDVMYGKEPTVFMRWASRHGAEQVHDGLGMLVGQAAHSFALWHGVMPAVSPVLAYLRKGL